MIEGPLLNFLLQLSQALVPWYNYDANPNQNATKKRQSSNTTIAPNPKCHKQSSSTEHQLNQVVVVNTTVDPSNVEENTIEMAIDETPSVNQTSAIIAPSDGIVPVPPQVQVPCNSRPTTIDDTTALITQSSAIIAPSDAIVQVPPPVQVPCNSRPTALTVLSSHPLACDLCNHAFKYPSDLSKHQKKSNCLNGPCSVKSGDHTHTIKNVAFIQSSEAIICFKTMTPNHLYSVDNKKNRAKCRIHGCKATMRIVEGKRYVEEKEMVSVFAVVGCSNHNHGMNIPLRGYCSQHHIHALIEGSFSTKEEGELYAKTCFWDNTFTTHHKVSQGDSEYHCSVTDCFARVTLSYSGKEVKVKGCSVHTHDDPELARNCVSSHTHKILDVRCPTVESAKDFIYNKKLDGQFRIRRTNVSKNRFTITYICVRHGQYDEKCTTKKNIVCGAQFRLIARKDKNGGPDIVKLFGCTTHSHPNDSSFWRLSKLTKDDAQAMLETGISKHIVKSKYFPTSEEIKKDMEKPVMYEDIRRIERKKCPVPWTLMLNDAEAIVKTLEEPCIRQFNVHKILPNQSIDTPDSIRHKMIQTPNDEVLIVYISEQQRGHFRRNPYTFCVDGMLILYIC
jgi:hypothetical protein